jgi:hypothetical protein
MTSSDREGGNGISRWAVSRRQQDKPHRQMPVSICTSISMSISMSTHTIVSISTVTDNSYNNIKSRSRRSNQRIFPALPLLFLLVQPNPIDLLISRVSADLYWLRQVYRIDRLIEYISLYATIMCLLVLSRPFSSCPVLSRLVYSTAALFRN